MPVLCAANTDEVVHRNIAVEENRRINRTKVVLTIDFPVGVLNAEIQKVQFIETIALMPVNKVFNYEKVESKRWLST